MLKDAAKSMAARKEQASALMPMAVRADKSLIARSLSSIVANACSASTSKRSSQQPTSRACDIARSKSFDLLFLMATLTASFAASPAATKESCFSSLASLQAVRNAFSNRRRSKGFKPNPSANSLKTSAISDKLAAPCSSHQTKAVEPKRESNWADDKTSAKPSTLVKSCVFGEPLLGGAADDADKEHPTFTELVCGIDDPFTSGHVSPSLKSARKSELPRPVPLRPAPLPLPRYIPPPCHDGMCADAWRASLLSSFSLPPALHLVGSVRSGNTCFGLGFTHGLPAPPRPRPLPRPVGA
mmetsp:Transcript_56666/g.147611  ORF Transcript_56666/g.147611 Transcript_56666/m.147611 type:complete len:299 (-) Transcript_56666:157-1053(-)